MAVEQIYTLPDKKGQTAFGVFGQTIAVLVGVVILACWIATQYAAHKLAYQPALGDPLLAFKGFKLYSPIDYFLWQLKFDHVEGTAPIWKTGELILFTLHFLFVPAIWLAVRRAKKLTGQAVDIHGSARWAIRDEIYRMGLLQRPLTWIQALLHRFIDTSTLPDWLRPLREFMGKKPTAGAQGVYVGAWIDKDTGEYNYLTHDGPEHVFAFAPTRSGKGVGLVLPTLLSWPASSLTHDIKGEAWALTAGYRRARGHKVLKFEPSADDGSSVRFNPLEEVRLGTRREVADAMNIAMMICDPDGKGLADHWAKTGHELLSAAILHILYAAKLEKRPKLGTLRGLVSFFCDPKRNIEKVAESMLNTEHDPTGEYRWEDPITGRMTKTHPMIAESARSFLNKAENERSGVQSTAMSYLSLYRDPIVAMNTAVSEFRVRDLMNSEKPVDLYLVVSPNDKARLRPLIRLVINQILRQNTEKMEFADGRSVAGYKHRLLMMLDEFPALGKLELIEESLAFVAGYGIKCYLIAQDLSQLYKAYTKDESIISNCHVRISYAPNKVETAELLSKWLGEQTVRLDNRSYSGNRLNPWLGHVMASENYQGRSLLKPDEVMRLPAAEKSPDGSRIIAPGDMLIFVAGFSPIYGQQILYFKDPVFDRRSKVAAPLVSDKCQVRQDLAPAPEPCPADLASIEVAAPDDDSKEDGSPAPAPAPATPAPTASPAAPPKTTASPSSAPVETAPQSSPPQSIPAQPSAPAAVAAAVAGAVVATAAAGSYTPEELAMMDAEEAALEEEDGGIDESVAAEMLAEEDNQAEEPKPAAADGIPSDLDFEV